MNNADARFHWLSTRLRELGMTKAELARAVGLPASRISEIIGRKNASPRKIKVAEIPKFAAALKMRPDEVLAKSGGESFTPIGDAPDEFDADAEAFKLIDTVASVRPLTSQERLDLFRKLTPLVAALRPKAR